MPEAAPGVRGQQEQRNIKIVVTVFDDSGRLVVKFVTTRKAGATVEVEE